MPVLDQSLTGLCDDSSLTGQCKLTSLESFYRVFKLIKVYAGVGGEGWPVLHCTYFHVSLYCVKLLKCCQRANPERRGA